MSTGRQRTFRPARTAASVSAPESAPEPSTPPAQAPAPVDPGPPVSVPADVPVSLGARVPRAGSDTMPAHQRREWQQRLRAAAGKVAATYRAAAQAEDAWDALAEDAVQAGVPSGMLLSVLTDAGVPGVDTRARA